VAAPLALFIPFPSGFQTVVRISSIAVRSSI